jgi:hypothetical protein
MEERARLVARAVEVVESPVLVRTVASLIRSGPALAEVLNDVDDLSVRDRLLTALLPFVEFDPSAN